MNLQKLVGFGPKMSKLIKIFLNTYAISCTHLLNFFNLHFLQLTCHYHTNYTSWLNSVLIGPNKSKLDQSN